MSTPESRSAFAGSLVPGRRGAAGPDPARLCEWRVSVVEVAARCGQGLDCAAKLRAALSLDPPAAGQATVGATVSMLWIAPETWLVVAPPRPPGSLALALASALGPLAAVMDQSSGLSALRLSGVRARPVLAKGCRIDLHPRVFRTGQVARTIIAQVPIVLHQVDEAPSYILLVPRTLAVSFAAFLLEASAEFGCEIGPPL